MWKKQEQKDSEKVNIKNEQKKAHENSGKNAVKKAKEKTLFFHIVKNTMKYSVKNTVKK